MLPKQLREIIDTFSKFPTVGERSATRFALYLLSLPNEKIEKIQKQISQLKEEIKLCEFCFNPFSPVKNEKLCPVCRDKNRNKKICIVEKETDLWQMEKTKAYNGFYFILGGQMNFLKENTLGKTRMEELKKRIEKFQPREVILALSPTSNGVMTMRYIKRILSPFKVKITYLARGLPTEGEIEYADENTLTSALKNRKSN